MLVDLNDLLVEHYDDTLDSKRRAGPSCSIDYVSEARCFYSAINTHFTLDYE